MYSDIPKFVVFGISGRGKSTFLNYLLQGPEQAKKDPIFKTASGSGSCTMECFAVQKKIFGTEQEVKIIDTPGIFNADMKLDKWFNIMKVGIPSSFNALLWVINIKERTLTLDTMLIASLQLIINNFDFKDLIFVFTHCDYLDNDDPTPMECAQQWIADLNATVKPDVPGTHIVLFGKKKGDQYTPNYTNEVVSAVASFNSSPLHVADNLKLDKAFAMKLLDQIDDKIVPAVEEELKRRCYDEYTQVYLWDVKQEKMIQVAMREVKVGDLLLTLKQEPSGEFMCQLEPAIVVNRYQNMPGAARHFVKILTEGNEGKRELKLHENHFIHVMREGKHICIIAKEVQHDDLLYIVDFNLGSTKPVQHHNMPKTVQIKSISYCQEGEISGPMNIRTPSLNLVVNDIWGSSKFNPDSGVVGHALVRLAARIHPSGGQKLQDLAHFLQLHRFLSP